MATKYYSGIDGSSIPFLGFVPEVLASAPSSPVEGRVYYDSGLHKVRYWNGTAWLNLDNIPAALSILDAQVSASAAIAESKLSLASDAVAATASRRTLGTGSQQAFPGTGRLDQVAVPTAAVALNSQKITGMADPASAQDAATKNYVDNARAGIAGVKDPVRVVATSNISITSAPASIDGVTLAAGNRVLLTAQTTTTQNGIYAYVASGSAMAYATDADGTGEILDGTLVAVAEGTAGQGHQYIQTATPSGAPGAWTQTWTVISTGGTTYTAGAGLSLSGGAFSVSPQLPLSLGGTNGTDAASARTSLGITGYLKYAATISSALVAGTGLDIVHSLGTQDVIVAIRDATSNAMVNMDVVAKDTNTVTLTSAIAVSASALKIVVLG